MATMTKIQMVSEIVNGLNKNEEIVKKVITYFKWTTNEKIINGLVKNNSKKHVENVYNIFMNACNHGIYGNEYAFLCLLKYIEQ